MGQEKQDNQEDQDIGFIPMICLMLVTGGFLFLIAGFILDSETLCTIGAYGMAAGGFILISMLFLLATALVFFKTFYYFRGKISNHPE